MCIRRSDKPMLIVTEVHPPEYLSPLLKSLWTLCSKNPVRRSERRRSASRMIAGRLLSPSGDSVWCGDIACGRGCPGVAAVRWAPDG